MTRLRRLAIATLFFFGSGPLFAQDIATITVRNRPAEDLVAAVKPLVGVEGSVTAFGDKLIVKAGPQALREVRVLVGQLDVAPRSLWITVRQSREAESEGKSAGVSGVVATNPGTVQTRDGGRTVTRTTRTQVTGAFAQGSASEAGQDLQQLRALDGRPAFISAGRAVPAATIAGSTYVEADSGFSVTPRVSGNLVTLEILTAGERVDAAGRIDRQQILATVSGRLGEWISLGSIERTETSAEKSVLARSDSRLALIRSVSLKVEEVR